MFLFRKTVKLLDTGSAEELKRKEKLLQDAGIRTNSWETYPFSPIDGPHMTAADWSDKKYENKAQQRIIYHLEVLAKDQYEAMKILLEDGGVDLSQS